MFHYTNFGSYGEQLKKYADMDGYVPESGDELSQFTFASGLFDDGDCEAIEDAWFDFVAEAVSATCDAEKALIAWRQEEGCC